MTSRSFRRGVKASVALAEAIGAPLAAAPDTVPSSRLLLS